MREKLREEHVEKEIQKGKREKVRLTDERVGRKGKMGGGDNEIK